MKLTTNVKIATGKVAKHWTQWIFCIQSNGSKVLNCMDGWSRMCAASEVSKTEKNNQKQQQKVK